MAGIKVLFNDITTLDVDAIVNTAKEKVLTGAAAAEQSMPLRADIWRLNAMISAAAPQEKRD